MHTFGLLILALIMLLCVSLQRTYAAVPLKELKRRARAGNDIAAALVKAVGYGYSLRAVLWTMIIGSSALFVVFASAEYPAWAAIMLSAFLLWLGYLWLPARQVTSVGEQFAAWLAPAVGKVASLVHPLVGRVGKFVQQNRPVRLHTGMYERQDFVELIERQQVQADNRIEHAELQVAKHALTYGDKTVGRVMTPRRVVTMVSSRDSVGPVLLDELHKSGHSRFPVYDGKPENIVGTLYLRDINRGGAHGSVTEHMTKRVFYVHEDQSLHDAFQAILQTHHHLFVVVNSFEEFVGIITMEDVLETMIGKVIVDEFDQYDDLRAVAARAARKDHKTNKEPVAPDSTEPVEPTKPTAAS